VELGRLPQLYQTWNDVGAGTLPYNSLLYETYSFTGAPIPQAVIPFVKSYHGIDGPLQTSSPAGMCATLELPFQKAMESLGIPILEDGYGGNVRGTPLH